MSEAKNKTKKTTTKTTEKKKVTPKKAEKQQAVDVEKIVEIPTKTTEKKKVTPKKVKEETVIDVEEMVEVPAEEVKESKEDATKRLFAELQELVRPLYNWLVTNFDANTSIDIRRERILVLHDSMVLNVVNEQQPQTETQDDK